ncbi:hypothetical protein [Actinacidiphila glaucinigra]
MEFVGGPPSRWHVELVTGQAMELWADGYSHVRGEYVFSNLVRLSVRDQAHADVTARTPADPERVMVAVARIAAESVTAVHTAERPLRSATCECPTAAG